MPRRRMYPDCFDEACQIAITDFRRLGYMKPQTRSSGSFSWTRAGHYSASIGFTVDTREGFVQLEYVVRDVAMSYRIELERRSSNLGKGHVWYFICPKTERRCRILYGIGDYFLSRHAYPAAMYRSQTEAKSDRGFRRFLTLYGTTKNPKAHWDFSDGKHFRTHYNGRVTRRFKQFVQRLMELDAVMEPGAWRTDPLLPGPK